MTVLEFDSFQFIYFARVLLECLWEGLHGRLKLCFQIRLERLYQLMVYIGNFNYTDSWRRVRSLLEFFLYFFAV